MAYVIDYAAAVAAANATLAAQTAEVTDPLVTKQGLALEKNARELADIASARFTGQETTTDSSPDYARSPAVTLPVAAGDSLEEAIAKMLSLVNKHPLPPGITLPYMPTSPADGAAAEVNKLDLLVVGQSTNPVSTNDGPFWELCDGTDYAVDLRNRTIMGVDGVNVVAATAGGDNTVTIGVNHLPPHKHQLPLTDETSHDSATPNGTQLDGGVDNGSGLRTGSGVYSVGNVLQNQVPMPLPNPPHVGVFFIRRTARLYHT